MRSKLSFLMCLGLDLLLLTGLASCLSDSPTMTSNEILTEIPTETQAPQSSSTAIPTDPINSGPIPVFRGAEGFGVDTLGGRGGAVMEVTNLDDSGAGSLRAAIDADGPRIVVFRVAGTIDLKSTLNIKNPYITVAGQTAPGGGITLRDQSLETDPLLAIETHDVVIRYLTWRAGPPAAGDAVGIISGDAHDSYNVVVDHNSMSWGVDQVFATWYDIHDITIQWNIFSEALNCSLHPKGCHSKGPMLGSYASDERKDKPGAYNISFHHNLMAHNGERNPLVKTSGVSDVVNNVVYNPFGTFSHVDMDSQLTLLPVNFIGNYFKPGPDTTPGKYGIRAINPGSFGTEIYVEGNIGPHRMTNDLPEIDIVDPDSRQYVVSLRHPAAPVTTTSAFEAYEQVLAEAGANQGLSCDGAFFVRRDAVDERIVGEVKDGTGKIIDDPSQVGGWLTIPLADPCSDLDHDGMPDLWEQKYGFNPNDASDASNDANGNGYTNIEEFLDGTNPLQ
ncbi:MAG TPA: hypothetical protein VK206_08085 [Anaerolineales bacterium]|nr:hypothetical protein [Anaerolineales bacterium]HLO28423.1 hypothetical protein [Anaerolineales bacterium]